MGRGTTSTIWCLAGTGLVAAAAYASFVAATWFRFGRTKSSSHDEIPDLHLEQLIPVYDVVERLQVQVSAPADRTFSVACNLHLLDSSLIHTIFRIREFVLDGTVNEHREELGLVEQATAWGWNKIAEQPGREVVFGAVTQPWVANPVFQGLSSTQFRNFQKPGFVKIAWTLRVDPVSPSKTIMSTETRVLATDADARARFRRYWSFVAPGTILIRRIALRNLKRRVEQTPDSRLFSEESLAR